MPVLWDNSEIRQQLTQPQTIRVRHQYRGPRKSYKINLEISQLSYDILRLYNRVRAAEETMQDHRMTLIEGGEIIDDLEVEGLDELIDRVARLKSRVDNLEA
jgi:hypothetical protein